MHQPSDKSHIRSTILLFVFFFLCHLALFVHFGAQFIDDSYITFRYAQRIADQQGFTFNDQSWVLGTTTPLWTFLLSVVSSVGIPVELGVGILTSLASALTSLILYRLIRNHAGVAVSLLAALIPLVYERWLFNLLMGMETMLYLALVLILLANTIERRHSASGFFAALCVLSRPDGAIAAAIAFLSLFFLDKRKSFIQFSIFVIVLLPWILFSLFTFGSIIPHSIAAKQVIHPSGFVSAFSAPWRILFADRFFLLSMLFGGLALLLICSRYRKYWPLPAWIGLYAVGMGASGIQVGLFPWYFGPLILMMWLMSALGIVWLAQIVGKVRLQNVRLQALSFAFAITVIVAIAILNSGFLRRNWRAFPEVLTAKERYYYTMARGLAPIIAAGDGVLVGEVGVFAYVLKDASIIDSSGINSPAVYAIRRKYKSGSNDTEKGALPGWVEEVIQSLEPEWILSLPQFVGMEAVVANPSLLPDYELIAGPAPAKGGLVVMRRRDR